MQSYSGDEHTSPRKHPSPPPSRTGFRCPNQPLARTYLFGIFHFFILFDLFSELARALHLHPIDRRRKNTFNDQIADLLRVI